MDILPYRTPEKPALPNWRRRYAIFVPVIGVCYVMCTFIALQIWIDYMAQAPQSVPKAVDVFGKIVCFPMLTIFEPHDSAIVVIFGLINAMIWGFSVVGACHLISLGRRP